MFANHSVFNTINLGNSYPIQLSTMIEVIAKNCAVTPIINQLPMQAGDVEQTYADISKARDLIGYSPKVPFEEGIERFVKWFTQKNSTRSIA